MSNNIYAQGAYNGVPYKLLYSEFNNRLDWGLVDPREWDHEAAFLIFKNNRNDDSLIRELPDKYVEDCQGPLVELCLKHKEKVAAVLEDFQKDGHDVFADDRYNEDDLEDPAKRLGMAEELIYAMCQDSSFEVITDMMRFCQIPLREGVIADQQTRYQYLYYRTDGQPIQEKIEENFNASYDEIKNWVMGNCFDVEIPGECFHSNVTDHFSSHESPHPLSELIKTQIDRLRANKKGRYKIIASRATYDEAADKINYAADDNIELFTSDKETARRMVNFYGGHALMRENEAHIQAR